MHLLHLVHGLFSCRQTHRPVLTSKPKCCVIRGSDAPIVALRHPCRAPGTARSDLTAPPYSGTTRGLIPILQWESPGADRDSRRRGTPGSPAPTQHQDGPHGRAGPRPRCDTPTPRPCQLPLLSFSPREPRASEAPSDWGWSAHPLPPGPRDPTSRQAWARVTPRSRRHRFMSQRHRQNRDPPLPPRPPLLGEAARGLGWVPAGPQHALPGSHTPSHAGAGSAPKVSLGRGWGRRASFGGQGPERQRGKAGRESRGPDQGAAFGAVAGAGLLPLGTILRHVPGSGSPVSLVLGTGAPHPLQGRIPHPWFPGSETELRSAQVFLEAW